MEMYTWKWVNLCWKTKKGIKLFSIKWKKMSYWIYFIGLLCWRQWNIKNQKKKIGDEKKGLNVYVLFLLLLVCVSSSMLVLLSFVSLNTNDFHEFYDFLIQHCYVIRMKKGLIIYLSLSSDTFSLLFEHFLFSFNKWFFYLMSRLIFWLYRDQQPYCWISFFLCESRSMLAHI